MPLIGEPDFEAWLDSRAGSDLPAERESGAYEFCQSCGTKPGRSLALLHGCCEICLAREFGWDQAAAAGTIAGTMRVELSRVPYLPASLLQVLTDAALERDDRPARRGTRKIHRPERFEDSWT
jgi:hypothetical protein